MTQRLVHLASLIELLGLLPSGKVTVSMSGRPILSLNADEKTLDVETEGMTDAGVHLSDLVKLQEGRGAIIEGPTRTAGVLSRLGWKLTLYGEGDRILSMGSGVSRLKGHISLNPVRLRKLLRALR